MLSSSLTKHQYTKYTLPLLVFFLCLSCQEPIQEQYGLLDRPRILAMKVDPLTSAPEQPTTFEALITAPDGKRIKPEVTWSWCPYQPRAASQYACPVGYFEYRSMLQNAAEKLELQENIPTGFYERIPEFNLGTGPNATFTHSLYGIEVTLLCFLTTYAGLERNTNLLELVSSIPCELGTEAFAIATFQNGDKPTSVKKSFFLELAPGDALHNPKITTIQIRAANENQASELSRTLPWVDPDAEHDEQWVDLAPDEAIVLLRNYKYELRVVLDPQSLDPLRLRTQPNEQNSMTMEPPRLNPDELPTEGLSPSWFASVDILDFLSGPGVYFFTSEEADGEVYTLLQNTIDLSQARQQKSINQTCDPAQNCEVSLHLVLRDEQLGTQWFSFKTLILKEL